MWESFRKNTRKSTRRILLLLVVALVVAVAVTVILRMREYDGGLLFTDRNAEERELPERETEESGEDRMELRVDTEALTVEGRRYPDPEEAYEVLKKAADEGKAFLIIDDYASVRNYESTLKLLERLGVTGDRIREGRAD